MNTKIVEISYESLEPIVHFWREIHGVNSWFIADTYKGLAEKFINKVIITDEENFEKLKGKPVLYFANHQTLSESIVFIYLLGGLTKTTITAIAKEELQSNWLGVTPTFPKTS